MTLQNPISGPNAVAEYQVSGVPFFTSSNVPPTGFFSVAFPFVTRTIKVRNLSSNSIQVGVTQNGAQTTNYYIMPGSTSEEFLFRTTTLFVYSPLGASVSVAAGLTTIPQQNFPLLTGSVSGSNIPGVG